MSTATLKRSFNVLEINSFDEVRFALEAEVIDWDHSEDEFKAGLAASFKSLAEGKSELIALTDGLAAMRGLPINKFNPRICEGGKQ